MEKEEFYKYCDAGKCLLGRFVSKTCKRQSKRDKCFNDLQNKQPKKRTPLKRSSKPIRAKRDKRYEEMVREAWLAHAGIEMPPHGVTNKWKEYCMFWLCLSAEEKEKFLASVVHPRFLRHLQVAHILGKQAHPEHKYDIDNVVLINAVAHRRLDSYLDPITEEHISSQDRDNWFERIKSVHTRENIVRVENKQWFIP